MTTTRENARDTLQVLASALDSQRGALEELAAAIFPDADASSFQQLVFYKHFGQARRRFADSALVLNASALSSLKALYPGFDVRDWSVSTLVRVWLMNLIPVERNQEVLEKLFRHSEMGELQALYRGLYTLPNHEAFATRLAEGARTNMVSTFDAVAMANPLPAKLLDDTGWTQLVLKAVFMDRPLYRIVGLDERRTLALALAASDYVRERWAAGRAVIPELWRLMAIFEHDDLVENAGRAARSDDYLTAQAARLALTQMPGSQARDRLQTLPAADEILDDWTAIGVQYEKNKTTSHDVQVLYPSKIRPEAPPNVD